MPQRLVIPFLLAVLASLPTPLVAAQEAKDPVQDRSKPQGTVFQVSFSEGVLEQLGEATIPRTGRVLVLFSPEHGRQRDADPLEAPFFSPPQPIASVGVGGLQPTARTRIRLGDLVSGCVTTPPGLSAIDGSHRVRAVLDFGRSRSHSDPGNLVSAMATVELAAGEDQVVNLELDQWIDAEPLPSADNLKWIEYESPMLSRALGRPVVHRAGVALPHGYDNPRADRRYWPTIYVIPGFGGDHREAEQLARLLANPAARSIMPQAVWVVLDPNDRLGHHGFVDSENFGPRGTALVTEFIPWLEGRFRLVRDDPGQRLVTGHSSGGWSSIWLQMQYPEIFGGCFSSAPDPVSFDAFGTVDLYREPNLFRTADGRSRACMRSSLNLAIDRVVMTVEEEIAMEYAIAPDGTSGEQWDAWTAMFSGMDPLTRAPRRAYNAITGEINLEVIEADWSRYDINRMVREQPERFAPLFNDRIRILCGSRDTWYLERAVKRLRQTLDAIKSDDTNGNGYIEIVNGATHSTIVPRANERWFREMKAALDQAD